MKPLVADASALVEFLLRTETGRRLDESLTDTASDLHVPALCDIEVVAAMRRLVGAGAMGAARAREALSDYGDLPLTRHAHELLVGRIFQLRHNFTAYDATYVALAEGLGGALLTADARLGSAVQAVTDVPLAGVGAIRPPGGPT